MMAGSTRAVGLTDGIGALFSFWLPGAKGKVLILKPSREKAKERVIRVI